MLTAILCNKLEFGS